MSHNALSSEQRSANALIWFNFICKKQAKIVNYSLKLGLTTLAATAIYLPNLSQAAYAANSQGQSGNSVVTHPAFLPRILNLIPNSLNKLVGFAGANPTQDQAFLNAKIIQEIVERDFDCVTTLPQTDFSLAPNFKSAILAKTKSDSSVPSKIHQVRLGETLSQLAQEYGVSLTELSQLNQIDNSDFIAVEQQLMIPGQMFAKTTANQTQKPSTIVDNFPDRHPRVELGLASTDLKAKLPSKKTPVLRRVKTNKSKLDNDPYIAKLKAEIEQMRAEYRQQHQQQTDNSQVASKDTVESDLPSPAAESIPARRSIATSTAASQNSQTNLFIKDGVALKLPPLPSSEEYLPSAFDGYTWPAQGVLTSGYGWRWGRLHGGIDIAAPVGTPIVAAASGKVISAGWNSGGYGNLVKVQHLDGSITVYAHNNRILVSSGQRVNQGQQIAEMGNTGRSTGSHLHFEIRPRSQGRVNPLAFLN